MDFVDVVGGLVGVGVVVEFGVDDCVFGFCLVGGECGCFFECVVYV